MLVVRFAPSPTGYLHVGGARTALFNWLLAQKHGGRFILRIEDTDRERSKEEYVKQIIEDLKWLGLTPFEGPFRQTDRLNRYREIAFKLLDEGKAYRCFCSPEKLEKEREAARKQGKAYKYPGHCKNLSEEEITQRLERGEKFAIRIKIPKNEDLSFEDRVRGRINFSSSEFDDFVILKSDGMPTYNVAVVVDDHDMGVNLVVRGEDHITNTAKQIAIYKILGWEIPEFAHIPLILGPDKKRLSKRHGAKAVGEWRKEGIIPEAMMNFLALLGWSWDDKQQIFTKEELIEKFSLERVSKNPAVFDVDKLIWINSEHLKKKSAEEKAELVLPFLIEAGLVESEEVVDRAWLVEVIKVVGERLKKLTDIVAYADFLFLEDEKITYTPEDAKKACKNVEVLECVVDVVRNLELLTKWDRGEIENVIRSTSAEHNMGASKPIKAIRYAISAKFVTPGLFESMELLGKTRTVSRIRTFVEYAKSLLDTSKV